MSVILPNLAGSVDKGSLLLAAEKVENQQIKLKASNKYLVWINGKPYPPNEIIREAAKIQGLNINYYRLSGGESTNKFLRDMGFEVSKIEDSVVDTILQLIESYKEHIKISELQDELYKWELVKTYSGRPDTNATDFLAEIKDLRFHNLVYAMGIAVLNHLAKSNPEELRQLFIKLFDENIDISERVTQFNVETLKLYRDLGETLSHHQDERSIATYLTYKYPDKYTFYKNSIYQKYCKLIGVKPAKTGQKFVHYLELIDDLIQNYILKDSELIEMVKSYIPEYYDGTNHLILAQDILFQSFFKNEEPSDIDEVKIDLDANNKRYWLYAPGQNSEHWEEFYNEGIMALGWDDLGDLKQYETKAEIVLKLQELNETKMSKKNDATANYEFINGIAVGDIVIVKKGRGAILGYGEIESEYFYDDNRPEMKSCRRVNWIKKGFWETDHSLALKTLTDITNYNSDDENYEFYYEKLMGLMTGEIIKKPKMKKIELPINQILYGPPGTGKTYNTINKALEIIDPEFLELNKDKRSELIKRFNELKTKGQIVFSTFHQSMSYEDFVEGIKPVSVNDQVNYKIEKGIFKRISIESEKYSLTSSDDSIDKKIDFENRFDYLKNMLDEEDEKGLEIPMTKKQYYITGIDDSHIKFRKASGGTSHDLVISVLRDIYLGKRKYNQAGLGIYYYPLIEALKRVKPTADFKIAEVQNKEFVLIIDVINRGNVSQIFGELITLIEEDKRLGQENELKVTLPYSKEEFGVPANLHIIGTMNTADRSVEALDTALRRRFSFIEMVPKPELIRTEGSLKAKNGILDEIDLVAVLHIINKRIEKILDRDHMIGHSYFLKVKNLKGLKGTFQNSIIPLLQEYFFGDYGKIGLVIGKGFFHEIQNDQADDFFADFEYDAGSLIEKPTYHVKDVSMMSSDDFKEAINLLLGEKNIEK